VNNVLSIAQQWMITQRVESGADAAAVAKAKEEPGFVSVHVRKLWNQGRQWLGGLVKKPGAGSSSGYKRRK